MFSYIKNFYNAIFWYINVCMFDYISYFNNLFLTKDLGNFDLKFDRSPWSIKKNYNKSITTKFSTPYLFESSKS